MEWNGMEWNGMGKKESTHVFVERVYERVCGRGGRMEQGKDFVHNIEEGI